MKHRLVMNEEIFEMLKQIKKHQNQEKPLNTKEAAVFLDVTEKWLREHWEERNIPCYKKLGRLYFYKSELNDWIRSDRILEEKAIEYIGNQKLRKDIQPEVVRRKL